MREVKFRVWCKDKNQWEEDYCVLTSNGVLLHRVRSLWVPLNGDTHIIQFCTGLKDRNGKEIYDGDIIQDEHGKKYLIKWGINSNGFIAKTNEAHCNVYSSYHLSFKTQVIGNIYENQELLEVADE